MHRIWIAVLGLVALVCAADPAAASPACDQAIERAIAREKDTSALFVAARDDLPRLVVPCNRAPAQGKDACKQAFFSTTKEALEPYSRGGAAPKAAAGAPAPGCAPLFRVNIPVAAGEPPHACKELLKDRAARDKMSAGFVVEGQSPPRLVHLGECAGESCAQLYFFPGPSKPARRAEGKSVTRADSIEATSAACPAGWLLKLETQPDPTGDKPDPSAVDPRSVLQQYHAGSIGEQGATAQSIGDAADVAAEAIQILGQIVVDRASEAAYALITRRLKDLMHCDAHEKGASAAALGASTPFRATCQVIRPLRIQDLASSRSALLAAVITDVLREIRAKVAQEKIGLWKQGVALDRLIGAVVAEVGRLHGPRGSAMSERLVWSIIHESVGELTKGDTVDCEAVKGSPPTAAQDDGILRANQAVLLASLAIYHCQTASADKDFRGGLAACPVPKIVSALAASWTCSADARPSGKVQAKATVLAASLLKAQTAIDAQGKPDAAARAHHAIDAMFDAGCLYVDFEEQCPAGLLDAPAPGAPAAEKTIGLMRYILNAAVDADTNSVVAGAANGLEQFAFSASVSVTRPEAQRALRLVAALLQYSETYTGRDLSKEAAHEQRTKILESLTREMTSRQGRQEDSIWSVGGSLRGVGGVRVVDDDTLALFGPVSLPLGFGFQSGRREGSAGFHVELSLLDLGQYLSFEKKAEVRTPEFVDMFSPSILIGGYVGDDFPLTFGLIAGYSPNYDFDPAVEGSTPSINLGFTLGVYVPLFDLD